MTIKKFSLHAVTYTALIALAMLIAFPIYVTFVTAFKSPAESAANFFSLPHTLYLENFIEVMSDEHFSDYCMNSLLVTIGAVGLISIIVPTVAYAISQNMKRNRFFNFLYFFFIVSIFCPFTVLMIPTARVASRLGVMNQVGLVMIYCAFALGQGVYLYTGYYKSIPLELVEAAKIDGCGVLGSFSRIVFPLSKPMFVTIVILNTLWIWNDFQLPLIILNKSADMWTLPIYQYNFKSTYSFNYNLAFASFMFSIIPMIIMYAFCQRYIIEGLTAGAVKS